MRALISTLAMPVVRPNVDTLLIILDRTGDIAQLPVKPSQGIRQTPNNKLGVSLLCFAHALAPHGERLGIVPRTPAGQAQEGETGQFIDAIMDVTEQR